MHEQNLSQIQHYFNQQLYQQNMQQSGQDWTEVNEYLLESDHYDDDSDED